MSYAWILSVWVFSVPAFPHSQTAVADRGIRFSSGTSCALLQLIIRVQWEAEVVLGAGEARGCPLGPT